MRLPINLFLFLGSTALLVQGGWFFCQASPQIWAKQPGELHRLGQDDAQRLLARGKSKGPATVSWSYLQQDWWKLFQTANFTGKLPPKELTKDPAEEKKEPPKPDQRPLEQIIDLISLMYDPPIADGAGAQTHVVVRYRPEANVEPPPEVLKLYIATPAAAPMATRDTAPAAGTPAGKSPAAPPPRPAATGPNNRAMTALPISSGQREYAQYLKIGDKLWGQYSNIRLVEVSKDCEIAYFSRTVPPIPVDPANPGEPGKPDPATPEPREKLFKKGMELSQKMLEL
ncbi:MAG TPA: hypothetical protein VK348_15310, partial [Planctomycetota bacterium]|nr:hypothetical protein [Planctomycetota bacterium]